MLTGWSNIVCVVSDGNFVVVVPSNASVCGALMGCKLGFKALPEDLLQFEHREWLDKKVDTFLRTTGLA